MFLLQQNMLPDLHMHADITNKSERLQELDSLF